MRRRQLGLVPGRFPSAATTGAHAHHRVGGRAEQADYIPHHEPFQYYASTANPQHPPPSSRGRVATSDEANHQYDLHDFFDAVEAGTCRPSYLKASAYQDGHAGYRIPLDEQTFVVHVNLLQRLPAGSTRRCHRVRRLRRLVRSQVRATQPVRSTRDDLLAGGLRRKGTTPQLGGPAGRAMAAAAPGRASRSSWSRHGRSGTTSITSSSASRPSCASSRTTGSAGAHRRRVVRRLGRNTDNLFDFRHGGDGPGKLILDPITGR